VQQEVLESPRNAEAMAVYGIKRNTVVHFVLDWECVC